MDISRFQAKIIDNIDTVVGQLESILMDVNSRNKLEFQAVKNHIQDLYRSVCELEMACLNSEKGNLNTAKATLDALKKTVNREEIISSEDDIVSSEDDFAIPINALFGMESEPREEVVEASRAEEDVAENEVADFVEPQDDAQEEFQGEVQDDAQSSNQVENLADLQSATEDLAEDLGREAENEAEVLEVEVSLENEVEADETSVLGESILNEPEEIDETEEPDDFKLEPGGFELETNENDLEASEANEGASGFSEAVLENQPDLFSLEVNEGSAPTVQAAATSQTAAFEQTSSNLEEKSPAENIAESYITQMAELVQRRQMTKPQKNNSSMAVSSTAMPFATQKESPKTVKKDNLLDSLRGTKESLSGGQLRSMVDKFTSPQTIYDMQQTRAVDLKSCVSISEKYLLSKELFSGNQKDLMEAIHNLNEAGNSEAAGEVFLKMANERAWDTASWAYATFLELLRRRYPDIMKA